MLWKVNKHMKTNRLEQCSLHKEHPIKSYYYHPIILKIHLNKILEEQSALKLPDPFRMQVLPEHKPKHWKPLKTSLSFISHRRILLCGITQRPSVLLLGISTCQIDSTLQNNWLHLNFRWWHWWDKGCLWASQSSFESKVNIIYLLQEENKSHSLHFKKEYFRGPPNLAGVKKNTHTHGMKTRRFSPLFRSLLLKRMSDICLERLDQVLTTQSLRCGCKRSLWIWAFAYCHP